MPPTGRIHAHPPWVSRRGMRRRHPAVLGVGTVAGAAALAGAAIALRARRAGSPTPIDRARLQVRSVSRRFRRPAGQSYTCACGTEYRVSGTDRHRIYWAAGAPEHAPVLGDRCVECEAPLPSGRAISSA